MFVFSWSAKIRKILIFACLKDIQTYEEDVCKDVAFLTLSEDKVYITGIYILSEIYEFKLDPQECDKEE